MLQVGINSYIVGCKYIYVGNVKSDANGINSYIVGCKSGRILGTSHLGEQN